MSRGRRAPTLYDVAAEAGVSLATASRVINGSERRVAEPYRSRVLAAAERIDYRANLAAQAVAKGASRLAALLVSDIVDPYFAGIVSGVTRAADRHQLVVTVSITDRRPDREVLALQTVHGFAPRVVLMIGSRRTTESTPEIEAELRELERSGTSVVVIGGNQLPFPSVYSDDREGARTLSAAIAESGRRRIAILAGPEDLTIARDRCEGLLQGLEASGVTPTAVVHGEFDRDSGFATASRVVQDHDVDAIIAVNDVMAIGAMSALRSMGVDIPGDVAVAGFDDIWEARDAFPALTSVRVDLEGLGRHAVEVALGQAETSSALPTQLQLRASTGHAHPLAARDRVAEAPPASAQLDRRPHDPR